MYIDQVVRKEKFLAEHPEWSIVFVRSAGYFEATRDEPNTVITDHELRFLLDRVERATRAELPAAPPTGTPAESPNGPVDIRVSPLPAEVLLSGLAP